MLPYAQHVQEVLSFSDKLHEIPRTHWLAKVNNVLVYDWDRSLRESYST